ncbi:hypothetical protein C8F01DRAFT_1143829 [Mycena amicta]|nr:hypothetical protein C8F01DRAFT_1143829 [Mycena amicta]
MSNTLHPSLQVATLRRLPANFRLKALAASQGSNEALLFLSQAVELPSLDDRTKILLAPVFCSALDPDTIPDLHDLDTEEPRKLTALSCQVLVSIRALSLVLGVSNAFPPAVFADIWPRLWAWIAFMDSVPLAELPLNHQDSDRSQDATAFFYANTMRLLFRVRNSMRWEPALHAAVVRTPGVFQVIGRAWTRLVHTKGLPGIPEISAIIMLSRSPEGAEYMPALIQGLGGHAELAAVITAQWAQTCSPPRVPNVPSVYTPAALISACALTSSASPDLELRAALLATKGFIYALLLAVTAICRTEDMSTVAMLLTILDDLFHNVDVRKLMRDALEGHLIMALLLTTTSSLGKKDGPRISQLVERFLTHHLLRMSAYASVLPRLHSAVTNITTHGETYLRSPRLLKAWGNLVQLVDERFALLQSYIAKEIPILRWRACDNVKCCRISEKEMFRRCGNCLGTLYCSISCQRADWQDGHQASCSRLRRNRHELGLGAHDSAFIRVLAKTAYERVRDEVTLQHLIAYNQVKTTDNKDLLLRLRCTYVDLSAGPADVRTGLLEEPVLKTHRREIERIVRSEGRMEMHFVAMDHRGTGRRWVLLPLRCETKRRMEGIREIAGKMHVPTVATEMDEYRRLVEVLNGEMERECY